MNDRVRDGGDGVAPSAAAYRVAGIQMVSGLAWRQNLARALALLEQGVSQGARLLVLPENWAIFGEQGYREFARDAAFSAEIFATLGAFCRQHKVWLCAGSMPTLTSGAAQLGAADTEKRCFSRCCLLDTAGCIVSSYDKMHLFDAKVNDAHRQYSESACFMPGLRAQVISTPFGKLGLAICYDLRFPEMFRWMAHQGAEVFLLPSAFTRVTGEAHWSVLTRARAIENLAYVVAPNQGGVHENGRETWGHTTVVDPWGEVLAECLTPGEGLVVADIDCARVHQLRERMSVLDHVQFVVHAP